VKRDGEAADPDGAALAADALRASGWRGWLRRLRAEPETEPESEEEIAALIDEIARWVVRRRLETPAILFLEAHKPLASLAGHSVVFAAPLMAPLFGMKRMDQLQRLMESSANLDRLIDRIEERAEAR
jgi:hypothetical protein